MRLLALGLALAAALPAAPRNWQPGDAPDRLMVLWREPLSRAELEAEAARLGLGSGPKADPQAALHARAGAVAVQRAELLPLDVVRLGPGSSGADVDRALAGYRASPLVRFAEPDPPIRRAAALNDPIFTAGRQAGLSATAWVQARAVWEAGAFVLAHPVTVAVLDTGVDPHPDLPALLTGASFVAAENDTDDRNGHGTFCAGLIGAVPGNGVGMAGAFLDPALLSILPVKVLGACGEGSYSGIALGILYAVAQGARVLNLSLNGQADLEILREATTEAQRRGAVLVAAAGNDDEPAGYPASYPAVISVGALAANGHPAGYSNFGKVDLSAPGGSALASCECTVSFGGCAQEVWSLAASTAAACGIPGDPDYVPPCGGTAYHAWAGTSFAAPLVAAAAALLLAQDPGQSPTQVMQRLVQAAQPTAAGAGFHPKAGWGRLDFYRALVQDRYSGPGAALRAYNWPNPFHPDRDHGTTFSIFLPQAQAFSVRLLDSGGDLVRRWDLGAQEAWTGLNLLRWDGLNGAGRPVANGGYLLVVESGGGRVTHRVAVLR